MKQLRLLFKVAICVFVTFIFISFISNISSILVGFILVISGLILSSIMVLGRSINFHDEYIWLVGSVLLIIGFSIIVGSLIPTYIINNTIFYSQLSSNLFTGIGILLSVCVGGTFLYYAVKIILEYKMSEHEEEACQEDSHSG